MKCLFVYNPNSGTGKIKRKLPYIEKRLAEKFDEVDIYATKAKGDLANKMSEVADSYDLIVFSGGDGTFNEVLQGLGDREKLPLLGYIPSGTANDVAHSLGIPRGSVRRALNVILNGRAERLDCMRVNGTQYAMYTVAAGAFTSASYTTPQQQKKSFGMLAYGLEGIKKNIPFRVFPVVIDSETEEIKTETVLTILMNGKCVAGWKMNPNGSMNDGLVECAIVRQRKKPNIFERIRALFVIAKLFAFGYHFKEKYLSRLDGSVIRINVPDDVVWNFDGERGLCGSIEVECLKKRVPLMVPKNNKNI